MEGTKARSQAHLPGRSVQQLQESTCFYHSPQRVSKGYNLSLVPLHLWGNSNISFVANRTVHRMQHLCFLFVNATGLLNMVHNSCFDPFAHPWSSLSKKLLATVYCLVLNCPRRTFRNSDVEMTVWTTHKGQAVDWGFLLQNSSTSPPPIKHWNTFEHKGISFNHWALFVWKGRM